MSGITLAELTHYTIEKRSRSLKRLSITKPTPNQHALDSPEAFIYITTETHKRICSAVVNYRADLNFAE